MHATIRLSKSENYQFLLFKKEPSKIASAYKLAVSVYNMAIKIIKAIVSFLTFPIAFPICYFLDWLDRLKCSRALKAGKIDSIAYAHINHSYAEAPKEQKQALEEHIFKKLKKHTPQLSDEQKRLLAHEIANNPKIYDKGGLCRPYSLLFGAYVLKHQDSFKGAKDLKDRFLQDISTKKGPPLIDFGSFVNIKALVKTKEDGSIVVESEKMHHPWMSSIKKRCKIMERLGYPSFKDKFAEEEIEIKTKIQALRNKLYAKIGLTTEESNQLTNLYNRLICFDEQFNQGSCLKEQILYSGTHYDTNAFYLGVPEHAMSFYINTKKRQFIFFDSNFGVVNFASLEDLAKGVSKYTEVVYKTKKGRIKPICLG